MVQLDLVFGRQWKYVQRGVKATQAGALLQVPVPVAKPWNVLTGARRTGINEPAGMRDVGREVANTPHSTIGLTSKRGGYKPPLLVFDYLRS